MPVVGLSMLLWDQSGVEAHGRCCGALDLGDARRVAQQAGIPHYTLRLDEEFRAEGRRSLRRRLPRRPHAEPLRALQHLDQVRPAPGARPPPRRGAGGDRPLRPHPGRAGRPRAAHRASTRTKDQSYYLFELTQEQLAASLFPLGGMTKPRCASSPARPASWWPRRARAWRSASSREESASSSRPRWRSIPTASPERRLAEPAVLVDSGRPGAGRGPALLPLHRGPAPRPRARRARARSSCWRSSRRRTGWSSERRGELLAPGLRGERLHWIGQPWRRGGDGEDPLPPPRRARARPGSPGGQGAK